MSAVGLPDVLPLIVALALAACDAADAEVTSRPAPRTESLGQPLSAAQFDLIAAGVVEGPALAVEDVLADATSYLGKRLRIEGEIVRVRRSAQLCITVGGAAGQLVVEFASPPPNLPTVSVGRRVLVEGTLQRDTVLHFVATGAAVRR